MICSTCGLVHLCAVCKSVDVILAVNTVWACAAHVEHAIDGVIVPSFPTLEQLPPLPLIPEGTR